MKKLTLVVVERELSTVRAALFLLQQECVDALPEDLAETRVVYGMPMAVPEIEALEPSSSRRR